jgi:anti-sigma B factor antagonist
MATPGTQRFELSVRVDRDPDEVLVLQLFGELDLGTVDTLRSALAEAEESRVRRYIVDLSALKFIDSTGLEVLVMAFKRSELNGRRFSLLRPTGEPAQVLASTGLDSVLPFED